MKAGGGGEEGVELQYRYLYQYFSFYLPADLQRALIKITLFVPLELIPSDRLQNEGPLNLGVGTLGASYFDARERNQLFDQNGIDFFFHGIRTGLADVWLQMARA